MCVKVEQVWLDGGSLAKMAAPIRFNNLNKLTANDLKKNELLRAERFFKSLSLKYLDHQFINFLRCRRTEKGGRQPEKRPRPTAHLFNLFFFKNQVRWIMFSTYKAGKNLKQKSHSLLGFQGHSSTWRE